MRIDNIFLSLDLFALLVLPLALGKLGRCG